MPTLLVRAHWSGRNAAVPVSLTPYGTPPSVPCPLPPWPSPGLAPTYEVWAALVQEVDLDTAQWGLNTMPPPPPWALASGAPPGTFDQAFGSGATRLTVTGIRL